MSNVVKAALNTFFQSFVPLFILSVSGWLVDLLDWVNNLGSEGAVVAFPDPSVLIKVVAAALISGIIGSIAAVHTELRNRGYLGETPTYTDATSRPVT
jgi:hypothetical protein